MKKSIQIISLIFISFAIANCGSSSSSKFSSTKAAQNTTQEPFADQVTPFSGNSQTSVQNITQHCADISQAQHSFYSYMKGISNRDAYGKLLESQGLCTLRGDGWQTYHGGYQQYEINRGTVHCNYWNQQPLGIWITFNQGFPQQAVIELVATGNGCPQDGQNCFPTKNMRFTNAVIDCNQQDLTVYAGYQGHVLTLHIPKEYGNKYTTDMRATVYYNSVELGTTFLSRR